MSEDVLNRLMEASDAIMSAYDAQVYLEALSCWVDQQVGACRDDQCRDLLNSVYMLLSPYEEMGVRRRLKEVDAIIDIERARIRLQLSSES